MLSNRLTQDDSVERLLRKQVVFILTHVVDSSSKLELIQLSV
jgi:hypothetical protein